jgi:signal transduction histidine kinase
LNANRKRIFIALAIVIAGACAFLFEGIYREAKSAAITKLNEQQRIYARQGARGIEEFFATWTGNLNALSQMSAVIAGGAEGRSALKLFYETNQARIMTITRLDEKGIIRDDFPDSSLVGTDISHQKHVAELMQDHKPVISDVFRSVEGVDAVALFVPIFRGAEFKGSVGVLVDFKSLSRRYFDALKIGKTGYAWVISRDGTILYTPVPGFIGTSILKAKSDNPSSEFLVNAMLQGREGTAEYISDRSGARHLGPTRRYAVYLPIRFGNTFWSICVDSSEQDVFADLTSFRNKLALVVGALFIFGMVFSTLGARAWLIVKEQEKRARAELEIARQRNQLVHLSRVSMLGELSGSIVHELGQPLTAILSNAQAAQRFLKQSSPDLSQLGDILTDIVADDQRAGEVIRRLRPLLKQGEMQFQPISANETVQEVLKVLHNELLGRGVTAQVELEPNLPVLHADRVGLQQVLINLITNACDAMAEMPHEDRHLTIHTGLAGGDFVLISVSDNGPGIAQERLKRIFEPFFTSKTHGMGLGLSVCRTIIAAHGGKLWANNNSGRGATFQFTLPTINS